VLAFGLSVILLIVIVAYFIKYMITDPLTQLNHKITNGEEANKMSKRSN
jgi:hypothetical protein